jgi:hypothetical protein
VPRPHLPTALQRGTRTRYEIERFLELLGLCALVFVQPVLNIFGNAGDDLVARRLTSMQIVVFAVGLAVVPPLVLWVATFLLGFISRTVETAAHKVVLALLAGAFAQQVIGRGGSTPVVSIGVGLLVAGLVGFLLFRWDSVRAWPRYASVSALLFVGLFLFASQATPIVLPDNSGSAIAYDITPANPMPVVMIVLDELPTSSLLDGKGKIDASLYPNFAELAAESTWFRNYATTAAGTNWAVPSILTGNMPIALAAPIAANYPDSLFTMLGGSYEMDVQESATRLCDASLCPPYNPEAGDLGALVDRSSQLWLDPVYGNTSAEEEKDTRFDQNNPLFFLPTDLHDQERISVFREGLVPTSTPQLHLGHFIWPHLPFEYTPEGRQCGDGQPQYPLGANQWTGQWVSDYGADSARVRHLMQLQYTDTWLGTVIDQLKTSELWDTAAILVVSDHGISFHEGHLRAFTEENWSDILYTALFVRGPGLTPGTVDDREASHLDLVPTIADLVDVQPPYTMAGRSLLAPPAATGVRKALRNPDDTIPPKGSYQEFDSAEGQKRLLASTAAPAGNDDLRIYRFGEWAPMIGRDVSTLRIGAPAAVTATVEGSGLSRQFDPASTTLDCFVTGKVPPTTQTPVAVALNGKVAMVVPVAEQKGQFWGALPESLFQPGANEVTLYAVEGSVANPTLRPISAGA